MSRAPIRIRPGRRRDAAAIADVYYRAYAHRFFDPVAQGPDGRPYGAPLAAEFPALAIGQTAPLFREIIDKIFASRGSAVLVAVTYEGDKRERIIGMLKGDLGAVAADDPIAGLLRYYGFAPALVGELGSLYIDPNWQGGGAGRLLSAAWAEIMVARGHQAMITRAYYRNSSPVFFARLGGKLLPGLSPIPNGYFYNGNPHDRRTLDIPGVTLLWTPPRLRALAKQTDMVLRKRPFRNLLLSLDP